MYGQLLDKKKTFFVLIKENKKKMLKRTIDIL